MTPEEVRQIIREELAKLMTAERWVFQQHIQLFDGRNIQVAKGTGTQIGTEGGATGQKLGFFGATPVVQQAHVSDASGGITEDTEARVAINTLLARLESLGLLRTS